ncbi:hypothetical protein NC653_008769 [Populus alba x Populus x berolinensis]|uniref:Uncharacterized protein n=1 Tax=Populus alba x Populus x berolinensis TaxID=444605 RepID=A0AAD6R7C4_9ROSI|nr:hypothetical protein NC653_008769 [Populus alba x Populus x berolinensis]
MGFVSRRNPHNICNVSNVYGHICREDHDIDGSTQILRFYEKKLNLSSAVNSSIF